MPSRLRSAFARILAALDGVAVRMPSVVRGILLGPVLYAVMIGSGVWAIRNPAALAQINTNKLSEPDTFKVLGYVAGALAAFLAFNGLAVLYRRVRTGDGRLTETSATIERLAFPLLALPLLALLNLPAIERDSPKLALFFIELAALVVARGVYAFAGSEALGERPVDLDDLPPGRARLRAFAARYGAALAVAALWAGYGVFFSWLSITNHHALNTRAIDLGYYDNIFYQTIHGHPLGCSFVKGGTHASAHFDPILIPLSPLYLIYQRAEMILTLQSVWLGAGVVPVYLIARENLKSRGAGVVLAAVYALYPALHGANMYEFHSLSLLCPILLWMLYFLQTGRHRAYLALLLPALLCREDVALLMCFVGLYAVVDARPRWVRSGWITIVVSCVYFIVVKRWFMPSSDILNGGDNSYGYAYYYEDLIPHNHGVRDLLVSLATNPTFVLQTVLSEAKIQYLLLLFAPLAFMPLLARPGRVMLIYGLMFCLLATRAAVFSVHFQYSSLLLPVAFAVAPVGLRQVTDGPLVASLGLDRRRLGRALLAACLTAGILVSWKFGAIIDNQSFRGGFAPVVRKLSDDMKANYAWLEDAMKKVPRQASMGVTNRMGAQAGNRMNVTFYPQGAIPEYVLLDESELRGGDLDRHRKYAQKGDIVEVSRRGQLALYKRK